MIDIVRREKKYLISSIEGERLKGLLGKLVKRDRHNTSQGYMVRSLYFDSVYDDDYMDKIDGLERRKKIRLRIYDVNQLHIKLELKEKHGENQRKRTLTISREVAEQMIRGQYMGLLACSDTLAHQLYYTMIKGAYRPKCIVQYNRSAYIGSENNIRITIDEKISFSETQINLFDNNLMLAPVGQQTVLEVKYDHFLSQYIKELVNTADKSETSFSKYVMARQISYR